MNKWALFLLTIATLIISTYPNTKNIMNLIIAILLIFIALSILLKGGKK